MSKDPKDFWRRFQSGLAVAVATSGQLPDKLLGVRQGLNRYLDGLQPRLQTLPVKVRPWTLEDRDEGLLLRDEETLRLARQRAREVAELEGMAVDDEHSATLAVGTETGLGQVEVDGKIRHFVRTWTVIAGLGDEAWGSSASLQLPQALVDGVHEPSEIGFAIPGTRRSGGMQASLTGGEITRRQATADATYNALVSLLYTRLGAPGSR